MGNAWKGTPIDSGRNPVLIEEDGEARRVDVKSWR